MEKELKENSKIILKGLKKKEQLSITDMVNELGLKRCAVRGSIAFLLGQNKLDEVKFGMVKVYFLK